MPDRALHPPPCPSAVSPFAVLCQPPEPRIVSMNRARELVSNAVNDPPYNSSPVRLPHHRTTRAQPDPNSQTDLGQLHGKLQSLVWCIRGSPRQCIGSSRASPSGFIRDLILADSTIIGHASRSSRSPGSNPRIHPHDQRAAQTPPISGPATRSHLIQRVMRPSPGSGVRHKSPTYRSGPPSPHNSPPRFRGTSAGDMYPERFGFPLGMPS